jgi:hypothetical protein
VIIFTGVPGYIYTIRSSDDMEDWGGSQEVSTMGISQVREFRIPVSLTAPCGFYKVER